MQTLRLIPDPAGLAQAARLLAQGRCVAIPTETVYGLAADARDGAAVAGIYQAKGLQPACVEACPTQALTFGTLVDLQKAQGGVAQVQWLPTPELTKPSLVIIPK